jgi:hypothetical protein
MSIAAMKMALEFLYRVHHWKEGKPDLHDTKEALRAAIEAAEKQEPVAIVCRDGSLEFYRPSSPRNEALLYTHPQPAVPEGWQSTEIPLYFETRRKGETHHFLNAAQMPAHATEWRIVAAPKPENVV